MTPPFRERIYTGASQDASLLNALLQNEGIQTIVAAASDFRRGDRQEIHVVNEAQVERARDIVASFLAGKPLVEPKTYKSWRCRSCNELIEGQFEACWKCGATK